MWQATSYSALDNWERAVARTPVSERSWCTKRWIHRLETPSGCNPRRRRPRRMRWSIFMTALPPAISGTTQRWKSWHGPNKNSPYLPAMPARLAGKPFLLGQGGFGFDPRCSSGPAGSPLWIAYSSNESGRYEVYARPFDPRSPNGTPAGGGKWQISTEGGVSPRWNGHGKEPFYVAPDGTVKSVELRGTNATFHSGIPSLSSSPRGSLLTRKARAPGFLARLEEPTLSMALALFHRIANGCFPVQSGTEFTSKSEFVGIRSNINFRANPTPCA